MIICAAIKVTTNELYRKAPIKADNLVICGLRHSDCFKTIKQLGPRWSTCDKIQGFINHKGDFLTREEALKHALDCGQISATNRNIINNKNLDQLFSEDLY